MAGTTEAVPAVATEGDELVVALSGKGFEEAFGTGDAAADGVADGDDAGDAGEGDGEGEGEAGGDLGVSTGDDADAGDDASTGDEGEGGEGEGDDATPSPDDSLVQENAELKQSLRETRREMALMAARMDRLTRQQDADRTASGSEDDDEDGTTRTVVEPTDLEKYQNELNEVATTRGSNLAEMVELMSLNPKFEDVREVCTRDRFDDIFEAAAKNQVAKTGADLVETQIKLELEVWKMPNPYRYMYDVIKEYHPDFKKGDATPTPGDKTEIKGAKPTDDAKARGKETPATATSAFDVAGGGAKGNSGWTAERIDKMPEHDLHKVPEDVYNAYLRGDLDT